MKNKVIRQQSNQASLGATDFDGLQVQQIQKPQCKNKTTIIIFAPPGMGSGIVVAKSIYIIQSGDNRGKRNRRTPP